jgi:hypothetical protein
LRATEAADRAKTPTLRLLALVRRGRLRIAGQTAEGHLLFRETEVVRAAKQLPARDLIDPDNRDSPPGLLPCGCYWAPPVCIGENGPPESEPEFLCPEAQGLDQARRLAAAFALAAPSDLFFCRLADVTREAFERHIADPGQRNATAPPGRDGAQSVVCVPTPPNDCAPLRRHSHQQR